MNTLILFSVVVALLVLLSVVSMIMNRRTENYRSCLCSQTDGGRAENCQNNDLVDLLYEEGKLTEYSKFKDRGWSKRSPGDMDFPNKQSCPSANVRGWTTDDFTDFGN